MSTDHLSWPGMRPGLAALALLGALAMSGCVVHHHHHHPAPSAAAINPTPEAPAPPSSSPTTSPPARDASPWRGGVAAQEPRSAAPHQATHQAPHHTPQPDLAPDPAPPRDTTGAQAPAPGRASKAATPTRKLYVVRAAPGGAVMIASPDLSAQELDSFRQMGAHVEESDIPDYSRRETSPIKGLMALSEAEALRLIADEAPEDAMAGRAALFLEGRAVNTPRGVLAGCAARSYRTGWIVAKCPEAELLVQTGPASRGTDNRLFHYAATLSLILLDAPTSYYGDAAKVTLGGASYQGTRFDLRHNTRGGWFKDWQPDREGQIMRRGVHAVVKSKHHGRLGLLCLQRADLPTDAKDSPCARHMEELATRSLDELGALKGDAVTVAGVTLRSQGRCYFSGLAQYHCPGGGLDWRTNLHDAPGYAQRALARWTEAPPEVPGFYNPHFKRACQIGQASTTCHQVNYQGVTKSPSTIYHLAIGQEDGRPAALVCSYSTQTSDAEPCDQLFARQDR